MAKKTYLTVVSPNGYLDLLGYSAPYQTKVLSYCILLSYSEGCGPSFGCFGWIRIRISKQVGSCLNIQIENPSKIEFFPSYILEQKLGVNLIRSDQNPDQLLPDLQPW